MGMVAQGDKQPGRGEPAALRARGRVARRKRDVMQASRERRHLKATRSARASKMPSTQAPKRPGLTCQPIW